MSDPKQPVGPTKFEFVISESFPRGTLLFLGPKPDHFDNSIKKWLEWAKRSAMLTNIGGKL